MTREEDVSRKVEIIRQYMEERKMDGAVLSRIDNFAWITSGARSYVALSDRTGVASVLITKDAAYVISKNPETERLKREELPENFTVVEYPWFAKLDDTLDQIADGKHLLFEEDPEFNNFMLRTRIRLSEYEQKRYAEVGEKTARAIEGAMKTLTPDMTEIEAKSVIESYLVKEGLDVLLVLVFGDESRTLYRHNLVRNVKVGKKCFASVCAKMYGLVISATRTVEFERDEIFEKQHEANVRIDSEILDATLNKWSMSQVFFEIEKSYSSHGYPDEWKLHHQGGIAGYNTRENVAIPHFPFQIAEGMSFAWNPTITGTKSEDTYVRTSDEMKLLSVNKNGNWPYLEVEVNGRTYHRPGVLIL